MKHFGWICAGLGVLALAAACRDQRDAPPTPEAKPPKLLAAVGPVPGPAPDTQPQTNPYRGVAAARMEGRKLFNHFNCSGCHGDHAGGGMGPSLRDEDWLYGSDEAQIYATIAEGRAHGMPTWGRNITDDQLWKLVTYIKSLRTADEPDAPR